ncbi:MAG: hypothetical protein PHV32_11835 [Eubacteriales bacterium]|nr:hypothetical protein [Eubacteriales bacterium]
MRIRIKRLFPAIALLLTIIVFTGGCGKNEDATGIDTTGSEPAAPTGTTLPEPTEPQLVEAFEGEIIIATDKSPEEWKSKAEYICQNGTLSPDLRNRLMRGGVYKFAPGEYVIDGLQLNIGSNTTVTGAYRIYQPYKQNEMLYPDPSYMAVFVTTSKLTSKDEATSSQTGQIIFKSAKNSVLRDVALSGHTGVKLENAQKSKVSNVLIHNYRGIYPNGEWCNMGYGKVIGSLWIFGNCREVEILNCQIQCSHHHGLTIHTGGGMASPQAKDIKITGTRALYCGSGMLRGESEARYKEAALRVPETGGYGYYDWSTAFDLCENSNVENLTVEDCYALDGWKAGYYIEPLGSGGIVKNLKMIRCRSDYAGRRAVIPGSSPKATIPQATEATNFFVQGGYFEDCISVVGEKSGWLINPNREGANPTGNGIMEMINCGDYGSPISLVTEMTDTRELYVKGFWSLNATKQAIWLFGRNKCKFEDTVILAKNQVNPPIKIGYMLRQAMRESRDPYETSLVAPGGKYDIIRVQMSDCSITGTVYNLQDIVKSAEIVKGSTFNRQKDPDNPGSGISLNRDNTTQINISDYVELYD